MIKRCHFVNVRSLRDVTIDLEPFTVLVGPNASGKSTVLEMLGPGRLNPANTWQHEADLQQAVQLQFHDGTEWIRSRNPRIKEGGGRPESYHQLLRLDPLKLRMENQVQRANRLAMYGENLANVFASLSRRTQIAVAAELSRLVPALQDVDLRPSETAGHQRFFFQDRWSESTWYRPEEVSDGTMLILAFLVLQYQEDPPEIIAIEEPERGLHPYLLEELVELLRRLSKGDLGPRAIQVVAATHSAELLDHLRPEEVRFLDRAADGSVVVYQPPAAEAEFQEAMQTYRDSLGSAWLAGGLGGVPGA